MMRACAQGDPEDVPPSPPPQPLDEADETLSSLDMASLAARIRHVEQAEEVQRRIESLPFAWVLVFAADTEEEAVYSMEADGDVDQHVVLAFEDREDAETYAASLSDAEVISGGYEGEASVQGLDVEALVVTSRGASTSRSIRDHPPQRDQR
jgi:hypothetical protein